MKGFIITLDAATAVIFLLFAIIVISSSNFDPHLPNGIYLKQMSLDVLAVLEKTGRINQALNGNSSAISEVIEATPHLSCMNISITSISGGSIINSVKSDCNDTSNLDIQTSSSIVVYNNSEYIVSSTSWIRKEAS